MKKHLAGFLLFLVSTHSLFAQNSISDGVPTFFPNLFLNESGSMTLEKNGQKLKEISTPDPYSIETFSGDPVSTETGIALNFKDKNLNGSIAYGPIDRKSPFPVVLFLPKPAKMKDGMATLEIKNVLKGPNDYLKIAESGEGLLGYRVMNQEGRILYEGRLAFKGKGPYTILPTIIEGPMVNDLSANGCILSYETSVPVKTEVKVGSLTFSDPSSSTHHEIRVTGLKPGVEQSYNVFTGENLFEGTFKTAPEKGSRKPFSFAFAAANRATTGGGERDFGGTNYQTTKTIMAMAASKGAAFMQATGDITNGGNYSESGHLLEYANWKRALEPYWSSMPVYTGYGDHEVNYMVFAADSTTGKTTKLDRFPYQTMSGEATFAKAFVHPQNGPYSEDSASYDPQPAHEDFPPYLENVYYYTYDNVAMIVLNTEYWKCHDLKVSGCPEGYLMEQQMKWLAATMQKMERDFAIDHIFVNVHSAVFPNGDHANGAMWYDGNNQIRAKIPGQKVALGILEIRDQLLDLCVNKSDKFIGFISGDEHNFTYLKVSEDVSIYPPAYELPKLKLKRSFYHINNGGGGSAPYALLETPWKKNFLDFTAPPVLAIISVNGKKVSMEAINTETMQTICKNIKLK